MSLIIADRKYDGTLERTIALALDHHVIFAGRFKGTGKDSFILLHHKAGWDGVAEAIAKAVREHFVVRPSSLKEIDKDISWDDHADALWEETKTEPTSIGTLLSMAARQMP